MAPFYGMCVPGIRLSDAGIPDNLNYTM